MLKAFGRGPFHQRQRAWLTSLPTLAAAESIRCTIRALDVALPGGLRPASTLKQAGAVVLTTGGVSAAVGPTLLFEAGWGPIDASMPATTGVGTDGLHVMIDVPGVLGEGAGILQLHFKTDIEQAAIVSLTHSTAQVPLSRDHLLQALPALLGA